MFENIKLNKPNKNVFNLSHEKKLSLNMGELVPILCEEVLPGDKWKVNSETLSRMAPMLAPVMHRIDTSIHYFFVPNRLVWEEWADFITGGEDGLAQPVMPTVNFNNDTVKAGQLADFMGAPTKENGIGANTAMSALPFRAYQLIYNEYFRDQNLQLKVPIDKSSGVDSNIVEMMTIRKRAWSKDYFTSALPWTQKGAEVTLPIGGSAPVTYDKSIDPQLLVKHSTGLAADTGDLSTIKSMDQSFIQSQSAPLDLDPNGSLSADLDQATAVTINEFRTAHRLQRWLERNARGGSRYIEVIKSHFGLTSSDARLQRPEFLGAGKTPMVISEVLQTSETATTAQGNMGGHGVSAGNTNSFEKGFEEHGYIIGIISMLPKTGYQQGFRKHLLKNDKYDIYWPEFANLGEQAIFNGELYHDFTTSVDKDTFGYQSRYAEYKFIPNSVHGDFKTTLSYWHMSRMFTQLPQLNESFIQSDPTERIFAVDDDGATDKIYVQVYNSIKAIRPIPKFSTPTL